MARRLFFIPRIHRGQAELRGEDALHLTRVLRVEKGHTYELSDNQHRYLGEVTAAHKDLVRFDIREKLPDSPPLPDLTLCAALVKFDRLEWIIEKATELGVTRIRPFWSGRTEKGLEQAAAKRIERWRKIAFESAQQSRRTHLPVIVDAVPFEDVLGTESAARYFLDEAHPGPCFEPANTTPAAILTGPEGGWTPREREQALAAGWQAASLGPLILRTETAAIAALAILGNALSR